MKILQFLYNNQKAYFCRFYTFTRKSESRPNRINKKPIRFANLSGIRSYFVLIIKSDSKKLKQNKNRTTKKFCKNNLLKKRNFFKKSKKSKKRACKLKKKWYVLSIPQLIRYVIQLKNLIPFFRIEVNYDKNFEKIRKQKNR